MFKNRELIEVQLNIMLDSKEKEIGPNLLTRMFKNTMLSGVPRQGEFIWGIEVLESAEVQEVNWICGGGIQIELVGNCFGSLPQMISFEQDLINDGWRGEDPYHGYTEAKMRYIKRHDTVVSLFQLWAEDGHRKNKYYERLCSIAKTLELPSDSTVHNILKNFKSPTEEQVELVAEIMAMRAVEVHSDLG